MERTLPPNINISLGSEDPFFSAFGIWVDSLSGSHREGFEWHELMKVGRYTCEVLPSKKKLDERKQRASELGELEYELEKIQLSPLKMLDERANKINGVNLSVYFETGDSTITPSDESDIQKYLNEVGKTRGEAVVIGRADLRGEQDYNQDLGFKRAERVSEILRRRGIMPTVISYGESNPISTGIDLESLSENRSVTINPTQGVIETALSLLPKSDNVLIDATLSMRGKNWREVVDYDFGPNQRIFIFSGGNIGFCGKPLDSYSPRGMTPLYESAMELISTLEPGKRLTVLTDGVNTGKKTSLQDVIGLANSREIKVDVIGVGLLHEESVSDLRKIAYETGGKIVLSSQ